MRQVRRFSYAASIGSLDFRVIPSSHREEMRKRLSEFAVISVRDERSLEFLADLDSEIADRSFLVQTQPSRVMSVILRNCRI